MTTALAFALGAAFGLLAATLGGWFDALSSRVVDVLMAIPPLIFALLILTITGTSVLALILVIAVLDSTWVFRLSRAVAQGILTMDYIEVARMRGEGLFWLIRKEVLPKLGRKRSRGLQRHLQMTHQMADTAMIPKQRIRDIIGRPLEFFLGLKGAARTARINELLTLIELNPDEFTDRLQSELSGGQKQRACIARALAAEPDFIICDEVTSALDQLVAEGILRLLDRLQKELDLTYLFITHDIATVRSIADEVVVMQSGVIVEQGPKKAIFTPAHAPYTELLLSSVPEMDPDWLTRLLKDRSELEQTR